MDWKHGKVLGSMSLSGYKFIETTYNPKAKLLPHEHNFVYFCFVLDGDFEESYGKTPTLYKKSTLIFHPLEETHSNYFHTKSNCFNIEMQSDYFAEKALNQKVLKNTLVFKGEKINYLSARLYKEFKSFDEYSHLTIEGLMLEIIAEAFRKSSVDSSISPPKWLLRAKEMLDEEFNENITVDSLAKSVETHPTHLVREFRRYYKMTIGEYVRQKRIRFASQKLISSNAPIVEIAIESGFFDQSHFTRIFKRVTGVTPAIFREIFKSR